MQAHGPQEWPQLVYKHHLTNSRWLERPGVATGLEASGGRALDGLTYVTEGILRGKSQKSMRYAKVKEGKVLTHPRLSTSSFSGPAG